MIQKIKRSKLGRFLKWLRYRYRVSRIPRRIVEHQYGPNRFTMELQDHTAYLWYDHDWEQQLPEIEFLYPERFKEGDLIFELGAHQGLIAMMFAAKVGPEGRIVAVEADPRNEAIAKRNYLLNNMNNIRSENRAVADSDGFIEIEMHDQARISNSRPSFHTSRIPSVSIDSLKEQHGEPSLVMLDIEGAEEIALRGADKTLQGTSDFTVEVHTGCGLEKIGGNVSSIINIFRLHGYDLYYRFEQDLEYRLLSDTIPDSRFFLIALNPRKR